MKSLFTTVRCTALITGATAGLGAEFARQLAQKASRIILVGRRSERLQYLSDSLKKLNQISNPSLQFDCICADLSLANERERLATWIIREEIPLNLLINNAGLGDLGSFDSAAWERLSCMLEVNITALTHLSYLLLPMLREHSPAAILNVSSVAGFYPLPEMAVYAATKAFVTSFSEALRMELSPEQIIVTALCPGPVPTEFFQVASRQGEAIRAMDRSHPLLATTAMDVVSMALQGLEKNRPSVIPNKLLALLVQGSRLLPFSMIRKAIELGAGPRKPKLGSKLVS